MVRAIIITMVILFRQVFALYIHTASSPAPAAPPPLRLLLIRIVQNTYNLLLTAKEIPFN